MLTLYYSVLTFIKQSFLCRAANKSGIAYNIVHIIMERQHDCLVHKQLLRFGIQLNLLRGVEGLLCLLHVLVVRQQFLGLAQIRLIVGSIADPARYCALEPKSVQGTKP